MHITPANVSPEVAQAAASTRTEAQARAQRDGSNVVRLADSAADRAQAAFFGTIDTARLLFLAKSEVHDLNQRDYISGMEFDERLIAECKRLCKGDELKARLLASAALEG